MDELLAFLLQFGNFNTQQLELIQQHATPRQLSKGAYFSEAGRIAREIAFITAGIFRVCYYNKDGDEITKYFVEEHHFAVDVNSYFHQIPSSEYIQAVTDMEVLVFSAQSMDQLGDTILIWDSVVSKIANRAMVEKFNKTSLMLAEDATTRYLNFHDRFPTLVNRIPLHHLASYIGVTKHSLSRIRKNIAK
jgi:CRP-like cAMP-binding protein